MFGWIIAVNDRPMAIVNEESKVEEKKKELRETHKKMQKGNDLEFYEDIYFWHTTKLPILS